MERNTKRAASQYVPSTKYWGDKIKKDELDSLCSTHMRDQKCNNFSWET